MRWEFLSQPWVSAALTLARGCTGSGWAQTGAGQRLHELLRGWLDWYYIMCNRSFSVSCLQTSGVSAFAAPANQHEWRGSSQGSTFVIGVAGLEDAGRG